MIDLKALWQKLDSAGLGNKPFSQMSKTEILSLLECVFSSPDLEDVPVDGWKSPYIDSRGELRIPPHIHPKERWWVAGGKSVMHTLVELDAPWETARNYIDGNTRTGIDDEEKWDQYKSNFGEVPF